VGAKKPKPRWSTERRLEFLEFRLYWDGRVNRGDLVEYFGISVPQASADLTRYQELAPGNLVYDKTAKAYVASRRFRPVILTPSADGYLAQLRLVDAGLLPVEDAWVGAPPPHAVVPSLRRRLDAKILRDILDAIRSHASVEVSYQSLSRPEPIWRRLTPHGLAFDGFRWHLRAWCHTRASFRDFVAGRIFALRGARPDAVDPGQDAGWTREVTLRIGPHPELEELHRRVTELDYEMRDGVVEVTARACMVPYLQRRFGLHRDPGKVSPKVQQIVLLNRDEVEAALQEVGVGFAQNPSEADAF
jgi:hypothetical protein